MKRCGIVEGEKNEENEGGKKRWSIREKECGSDKGRGETRKKSPEIEN